jgi:cell wall-associated NlpC family hydrolase
MAGSQEWLRAMLDSYSELLGVPYKRGGRDKTGLDCIGFLMYCYKKDGLTIPEYLTDDEDSIVYKTIIEDKQLVERIEKPEPKCTVLFRVGQYQFHVGIVLDDSLQFIHVDRKRNVCRESLQHIFWKNRIEGYYRWIR